MRKICFKIIHPEHIRMCVYRGVTGLVKKLIPEAGTKWPVYFGIKPKPIWCGWTYTSVEIHGGPYTVSASDFFNKWGKDMQVDPAAACAGAWAQYNPKAWSAGGTPYVGVQVEMTQVAGPACFCRVWGRKLQIDGKIEQWFADFPGVQPLRAVYHPVIREWGPDSGGMWLPDFYAYARMDAHIIDIPFDVSDVSFPPAGWKFKVEPYEGMQPYCVDGYPGERYQGALMGWYEWGTIDYYSGEAGWECINIPDWVFETPGKLWLAMTDAAGVMLPGPYLPLN